MKLALAVLAGIILASTSMAAGYGGVARSPVPTCNTCPQETFVPRTPVVRQPTIVNETVRQEVITYRDVVREIPVERDVPVYRDVPIYRDVPVRRDVPVYRDIPVVRNPVPCGVGTSFSTGVKVRSRGFSGGYVGGSRSFASANVNVNTGFNGGFVGGVGPNIVRTPRVDVQAAPGQRIDVREGGLRGVIFGRRTRVR